MKNIILVVSVNYLCRYSFSRNVFSDFPLHDLSFQILSFSGIILSDYILLRIFSGIVFSDYILLRNCLFRPGPFSKNIFSHLFLFRKSCFKKNKQSINEEISLILPYHKESAVYRPNFLDFRIHILYAIPHTALGSTTTIAICTQHGRRHGSMQVDKTTSLRSKSVGHPTPPVGGAPLWGTLLAWRESNTRRYACRWGRHSTSRPIHSLISWACQGPFCFLHSSASSALHRSKSFDILVIRPGSFVCPRV